MATENQMKLAQATYNTLCEALDDENWKYEKDDSKLLVRFGVTGDDIPMDFLLFCDVDYQIVRLISILPFKFPEDKRVDASLATNYINYDLAHGCFDYNFADGTILFRITTSFKESTLSKELFEYLIGVSCSTIDGYNDKLFLLSKGMMSLSDFIEK